MGPWGALTTTLIPHTHRLPVVLLRPPTITKVMVCDTACVSCEGNTDLSLPSCADLSHQNTTGVLQCLGRSTCCVNRRSFDKCRADCEHHRILSADITFADSINPPRMSTTVDGGMRMRRPVPCRHVSNPHATHSRYPDVLYTNLIVFAFTFLIWVIIVGLTCFIIYVP